jgi:hypothetical protein
MATAIAWTASSERSESGTGKISPIPVDFSGSPGHRNQSAPARLVADSRGDSSKYLPQWHLRRPFGRQAARPRANGTDLAASARDLVRHGGTMIKGLFGPSTLPRLLRGGLEETMQTHHQISERVAGALQASSSTDFSAAMEAANGTKPAKPDAVDLQREMSTLADTELRYEAEARLLQGAYAHLRTAIGGRNA